MNGRSRTLVAVSVLAVLSVVGAERAVAMAVVAPASGPPVATWKVSSQIISGVVPDLPESCTDVTNEAEAFLASDPASAGHLVAVWSAGKSTNTAVSATSTDGGATWSRAPIWGTGPCTDGPGNDVIDAWDAIDRGGRAYYDAFAQHGVAGQGTLDAQALVAVTSEDGSWNRAVVMDDDLQGTRGAISRTSITADPKKADRAWAVWGRFFNPLLQGIYVSRTDNGGTSWNAPVKVADVPGGAAAPYQLVERPNGELVLFYDEFDPVGLVVTQFGHQAWPTTVRAIRSVDNGDTWSDAAAVTVEPALTIGRAASAPDGSLVFVWDEMNENTSIATVWTARSTDGGRSWERSASPVATFAAGPIEIDIKGGPSVAPDVAVNDDGVIGVSYYDGSAGDGKIARWFARSADSGQTWTRQPLSAPFAADTPGNGDGPQGAYQGIAPLGHGFGAAFIVGTGDPANPSDVMFSRIMPPDWRKPTPHL